MDNESKIKCLRQIFKAKDTITTKVKSIGGGEWALEVYSSEGYEFELTGSNGTRSPEEDLDAVLNTLVEAAKSGR